MSYELPESVAISSDYSSATLLSYVLSPPSRLFAFPTSPVAATYGSGPP